VTRARRWFSPEVIQTSAMDCGPASLECLLEGFGVSVSYERLREACQTSVDGTSIDMLEEVACELGLDARQIMLPSDSLFIRGAEALPALVVTKQLSGLPHFVVAWRRSGAFVQLMDPGRGRRWVHVTRLIEELYVHTLTLPAATFHGWATADGFQAVLRRRLKRLGCERSCQALLERAARDPGWRPVATLDAAVRQVDELVAAGAVARGNEASALLGELVARAGEERSAIPERYWIVRPFWRAEATEDEVVLTGAVLLRVVGRRGGARAEGPAPSSPELERAVSRSPRRPMLDFWRWTSEAGALHPIAAAGAIGVSVAAVAVEAVLLRAVLGVDAYLSTPPLRLGAVAALLLFSVCLLVLALPTSRSLLRLGRQLELRLRIEFLRKLPSLSDRYFQSRPVSDMAERAHAIHAVRQLPELGARALRALLDLVVTCGALALLDPASTPRVLLLAAASLAIPLAFQPALIERDAKVRTYQGAMARFVLDALLGGTAIESHAGERNVLSEHEGILAEWVRASRAWARATVAVDAAVMAVTSSMVVWLVLSYLERVREPSCVLLLIYWALNLPLIAGEFVLALRQYPSLRSRTSRLLEPISATDPPAPAAPSEPGRERHGERDSARGGVEICFDDVSVVASGRPLLAGLKVTIPAGSEVVIVGRSGAGKSSFVGTLLGWHAAATGQIRVDGVALDAHSLEALRRQTAWVDPDVTLWNGSLYDNVMYGADGAAPPLARCIDDADLGRLLSSLPDGLQSELGEGGGKLAGGEGQRVRLARALMRQDARLVILDEPFRGLEREQRQRLLERARAGWRGATVLFVTHDVAHALDFERVLVMQHGRLVEDGPPRALASREGSAFAELLAAEEATRAALPGSASWRRLVMVDGKIARAPGAA
jgi:ABC-type bacteriocin/lantibiotic exporter with double-glycine peptidase domain